jgi:hypothetical protein
MSRSTNHSLRSHSYKATVLRNAALLLAGCAAAAVGQTASANLLTNPGFEISVTTSASNVLNNFPTFQGIWGPEVGGITGPTGGVTPAAGSNMLEMYTDGLSYTQTFQTVDVSSFSTMINAGSATVTGSALFNTVGGYVGAWSAINITFFSGNTYGTVISTSTSGILNLDANPMTWESSSSSAVVPVGTTWMLFQVAYNNASIGNNPGFVDDTYMNIVPTPGAIALLGLAGLAGRRRRN